MSKPEQIATGPGPQGGRKGRPALLPLLAILIPLLLFAETTMATDPHLSDAFICDLGPDTRIQVLRAATPLDLAGQPLGTPLFAGDRLILAAGWIEVCTRYSAQRKRLLAPADKAPPLAYDIEADRLPSPFSRLREAVSALAALLAPQPDGELVELITKGRGGERRDRVFPPKRCLATPDDRFAIAWDLDLVSPVLTLTWPIGHERIKDLVDDPGHYVFPYDLRTLLARHGTDIDAETRAGESLEIRWTLADKPSDKSAVGVLHIRAGLEADLAEALEAPEITGRDDALALRVALLMGRGYCLRARQEWRAAGEKATGAEQETATKRLERILGR